MGYYIETGTASGKAAILVNRDGAEIVPKPDNFSNIPAGKALICVVDNQLFEAAGYCFSPEEFSVFSEPSDPLPKTWLYMDLDKAQTLSRFKDSWDYKRMNIV